MRSIGLRLTLQLSLGGRRLGQGNGLMFPRSSVKIASSFSSSFSFGLQEKKNKYSSSPGSRRSLVLVAAAAAASGTIAWANKDDDDDWLEEVEGVRALDWVRRQNARTLSAWGNPEESSTYSKVLEALESKDKIPGVSKIGDYYYNFWTDGDRPRGILRRCTPAEYIKEDIEWELVLDIDALGKEDKCSYVYKGTKSYKPNPKKTLVALSPGGSDAILRREYDFIKKKFISKEENGFIIDTAAKHSVSWLDEDTLLISIGLNEHELTDSGYPRVVREWKRGIRLEDAPIVFQGEKSDVSVGGSITRSRGVELEWQYRSPAFYTSNKSVRYHIPGKRDSVWYNLQELGIPEDASVFSHGAVLLIELRSAALSFPAGALLAVGLDDLCENTSTNAHFEPVFLPSSHTSLKGISASKNLLALVVQDHVKSSIDFFSVDLAPHEKNNQKTVQVLKKSTIIPKALKQPQIRAVSMSAVDSDESDDFFLRTSSFLEPSTLSLLEVPPNLTDEASIQTLKQLPTMFTIQKNQMVEQRFATSADGTQVPYFVVHGKNKESPCLIFAYGGFEISLGPSYSAALGRGWFERGGHYVLANLRGGGEYGPDWHKQALRENRQKAYDDLHAVAEHLVESKLVDSPKRIAVRGGSNGGLLVTNAYVQKPQLYGAIVSAVPLTHMKKFSKLLAGASWMDEYGDPDSDDWTNFLSKYSPYHNIQAKDIPIYPPLLVTTSTKDDRVHPYHARAFTNKLLELGAKNVWYYENVEGGHSGTADAKQSAYVTALYMDMLFTLLSSSTASSASDGSSSSSSSSTPTQS